MTKGVETRTAAMEGAGFYNRNSSLQASTLTSALPLLQEAAATIPIEGDSTMVIVDYGSSQGRNSMLPVGMALDTLRARIGQHRPIEVFHTDLPSNDFQSLFTLLAEDPSSYLIGRTNVFSCAIGRSYFETILPPRRVDLGWTSNALHWMSRPPIEVHDHGWAVLSASQAARESVDRILAEDWRAFLLARSTELRDGGKLICQFMGRGAEHHGFEWMSGSFWQSVVDMQQDGLLSPDELLRMNCPAAGRSVAQIEAPFANGTFAGLALTHISVVENPDPFWQAYSETGDADHLGRSWAMAMRAANGPNFAAALDTRRDTEAFLEALTKRLATRIAGDPQRSQSYMLIVALEKTPSRSSFPAAAMAVAAQD